MGDSVQDEIMTIPEVSAYLRLAKSTVMGGIAFLIEYLDDTLKTPEDIHNILGLPVVGFVAEMRELNSSQKRENMEITGPYVALHPRSSVAESFRGLRTNLEFAGVDNSLKTILITSPGPFEGKTTIAANLAAVYSQAKNHVALVDCDLRRPMVHRVFGLPNNIGLSNLFLDQSGLQDVAHMWDESVAVIPSGELPPNPAELLGSMKMTQILEGLKKVADVVLIDSPPSVVSDAVVLSAKVDGVLIIIQPGHTHAGAALALLEQLGRANARIVGVVLNKIPRKQAGYYGRYRYNYAPYYDKDGYYSSDDGQDPGDNSYAKRRFAKLASLFGRRSSKLL